jgi:hypothetical protein
MEKRYVLFELKTEFLHNLDEVRTSKDLKICI